MNRLIGRLLAILLMAHGAVSHAGALQVAPTRLDLPGDKRAVALTVTNTGNAPMLMQLESMRWAQTTGNDDYSPTDELIASPPIFTLEAGAAQVVRVARRDGSRVSAERAYRIFIQEVPTPATTSAPALAVVLRIGLPVFVTPASATDAALQWSLRCATASPPVLLITNPGSRVVRLDELIVRVGSTDHAERAMYVLAGATRRLSLPDFSASARRLELRARMAQREAQESASCETGTDERSPPLP